MVRFEAPATSQAQELAAEPLRGWCCGAVQLPLSLLRTAVGHPMLVELKNGETYNGHLVSCDSWMNLNLREVVCTSKVRAKPRIHLQRNCCPLHGCTADIGVA